MLFFDNAVFKGPLRRQEEQMLNTIIERCKKIGLEFDQNYRVETPEKNLITLFNNWEVILTEISKGQGSELKQINDKRPKFCSVFSSSCLCVNNFALIKQKCSEFTIFGIGPFNIAKFEEKLPTGISTPNIDFYLENQCSIIGIESKYTETLKKITPNKPDKNGIGNLSKYVNRKSEIHFLPEGFVESVLNYYIKIKEPYYLDVAQLIKHSLGLIRRSHELKVKPTLIYIYWEPINKDTVDSYKKHKNQLLEFNEKILKFIDFRYLPYSDFWEMYRDSEIFKSIVNKNIERYTV